MLFVGKGLVCIFVCYCASLDHFGFVLLVLLDLVFPVPSQELGREGRLRNNVFCVGWDVKRKTLLHPSNTWFLPWAQRLHTPNGICIGSAVLKSSRS